MEMKNKAKKNSKIFKNVSFIYYYTNKPAILNFIMQILVKIYILLLNI